MPLLNHVALTLFLTLLIAGCGGGSQRADTPQEDTSSSGATASQEAALAGPTWRLVAFGAAAGAPALMEDTAITATFSEEERRLAGSAGCNRYFGSYTRDGDALTFSQMGATRRACPPPVMEQEQAYLSALEAVAHWTRTDSQLTITNADGAPLLRFAAEQDGGSNEATMAPQPTGETFVFDCTDPAGGEDFSFTIKTGPGELALWLPERFATGAAGKTNDASERYLVLGQMRAASGAKYESGGVTVWNKGDEALLEVDGETFPGCQKNPQRRVHSNNHP